MDSAESIKEKDLTFRMAVRLVCHVSFQAVFPYMEPSVSLSIRRGKPVITVAVPVQHGVTPHQFTLLGEQVLEQWASGTDASAQVELIRIP